MEKAARRTFIGLLALLLLIISFGIIHTFSHKSHDIPFTAGDTLRCAISLRVLDDMTGKLVSGYNYELLQRFAKEIEAEIEICDAKIENMSIDSLRDGDLDILVVPNDDYISIEGVMPSNPVDSLSIWLIKNNERKLDQINEWINTYQNSEEFQDCHNIFLMTYDPIRAAKAGRKRYVLGPYDKLIKQYADSLEWDWRLLAAVIFQESRFNISAHSHKGAIGVMQMIPSTAQRYDVYNIFDPEESIKGGVRYLKRLQNMFRKYAATPEDRIKFSIAGYNAGEGNVLKCLHYADSLDVKISTWDELALIMPLFDFKWEETLSHVSRSYSFYWAFSMIYAPAPGEDKKYFMPISLSEPDLF